jgi:hypothetical protein
MVANLDSIFCIPEGDDSVSEFLAAFSWWKEVLENAHDTLS